MNRRNDTCGSQSDSSVGSSSLQSEDLLSPAGVQAMQVQDSKRHPFPVRQPTIEVHGPVAFHDYACTICQVRHAVIDLREGIFKPCWKCQEVWEVRRIPWWKRLRKGTK